MLTFFFYILYVGGVGGTYNFMAPEVTGNYPELQAWRKAPKLDIYSFGLVVFQVATNGLIPYEDEEDPFESKYHDTELKLLLEQIPKNTPVEFRNAIESTAKFKPPERATLDRVERMFLKYIRRKMKLIRRRGKGRLLVDAHWEYMYSTIM